MENNIFSKYITMVTENKNEKTLIINHIQEKTGISFTEKEIVVNKKLRNVKIITSANKKMLFVLKRGEEILKEMKYKSSLG
jgi:hypothetical protein